MARLHEQYKRRMRRKGVMRTKEHDKNAPNKFRPRLVGVVEFYRKQEK